MFILLIVFVCLSDSNYCHFQALVDEAKSRYEKVKFRVVDLVSFLFLFFSLPFQLAGLISLQFPFSVYGT